MIFGTAKLCTNSRRSSQLSYCLLYGYQKMSRFSRLIASHLSPYYQQGTTIKYKRKRCLFDTRHLSAWYGITYYASTSIFLNLCHSFKSVSLPPSLPLSLSLSLFFLTLRSLGYKYLLFIISEWIHSQDERTMYALQQPKIDRRRTRRNLHNRWSCDDRAVVQSASIHGCPGQQGECLPLGLRRNRSCHCCGGTVAVAVDDLSRDADDAEAADEGDEDG